MKKKLDLSTALQRWVSGSKVAVVLDADITFFKLDEIKMLDGIGADFLVEVPDGEIRADLITTAAKEIEADEPAQSPPAEAKAPRRAMVDVGKVKALRKAGWTLKAIAEEVRCSPQNVSVILNKERADAVE